MSAAKLFRALALYRDKIDDEDLIELINKMNCMCVAYVIHVCFKGSVYSRDAIEPTSDLTSNTAKHDT